MIKKMLIHHYDKSAKKFRDCFIEILNQMGYPKKLRKVAIVNHSIAGKNYGNQNI